jgi:hypothetical protein
MLNPYKPIESLIELLKKAYGALGASAPSTLGGKIGPILGGIARSGLEGAAAGSAGAGLLQRNPQFVANMFAYFAASQATRNFTNWMVSFAESYYGLAAAIKAQSSMIPRVVSYLNGQTQKSPMLLAIDHAQSLPPGDFGPLAAILGLETIQRLPSFVRR